MKETIPIQIKPLNILGGQASPTKLEKKYAPETILSISPLRRLSMKINSSSQFKISKDWLIFQKLSSTMPITEQLTPPC